MTTSQAVKLPDEVESLPSTWRWGKVGETGQFINGLAFKPADWTETGTPIIRIQNLTNPDKPMNRTQREVDPKYIIKSGDILVSWSATLDAFKWHGDDAILNQHIFKVVPDQSVVTPSFLYYLLKLAIQQMIKSEHLHGSTMKHINRKPFLAHPVPLPSLEDQDRIVAEIEKQFTRLDAGVAAVERAQANLKRYRASVLKAACEGRLVPTEADLAREEGRDYESGEHLLERILTERRESWQGRGKYKEPTPPDTTDLPELPEGWVWASLEQVTNASRPICYGILMPKKDVPDGVLYVKVKNLKGDKVDLAGLHRTTREIADKYKRSSLKTGDLLLAIRGTYGRVAEVPPELNGGNVTQDTARLDISGLADLQYVATCLRSPDCQNYFKRVARGVAVKGVNIGDVKPTPVALPPLAEQQRIVAEVERRLSVADEVEAALTANHKRAARLRQSILQKAFSGKLR